MTEQPPPVPAPVPDRGISWAAVIGGILLTLFTGIFVVLGGFLLGLFLIDSTRSSALAGLLAALVPAVIYVPSWLLLRHRTPDFAKGILIGGCIVIILGGICNGVVIGDMGPGGLNFH